MNKILTEGLVYNESQGQSIPKLTIDKYEAKMGSDDEIVTVSMVVKSNSASEDLVDWFERGYDWVLDGKVSDGELTTNKYVVFIELDRRSKVPERIVELVEDMETLTGLTVEDWKMEIDGQEYPLDAEKIRELVPLSPHMYRELHPEDDAEEDEQEVEDELNEMREQAGLPHHKVHKSEHDSLLKDFIAKAGL